MSKRADVDFEVRWLPFQLNPEASNTPSSKMQMYAQKFGKNPEEVKQMGEWMGAKFHAVNLPYNFTEKGSVSNTFEAHRVLTAAYARGGAAAQDRAMESLFTSYFGEELAPNDPNALKKAAELAGVPEVISDTSIGAAETKEDFGIGRKLKVSGVPHFVISREGGASVQVSGAQPPEEFAAAFSRVVR